VLGGIHAGDEMTLVVRRGDDETVTSTVVAASGEGARLVSTASEKGVAKDAPEKKDDAPQAADAKPAFLGVDVVADDSGVAILSVLPDGAAAAAGLKEGDVLKKFGGDDVGGVDALRAKLAGLRAGDKVDVVVGRDGKDVTIEGLQLAAEGEKVARAEPPAKRNRGVMGIVARETNDGKVIVNEVTAGGPGAEAGLQPGDVLLKIQARDIGGFDDVEAALGGAFAGDEVSIDVQRGDESVSVKLTLGDAGA